MFPDGSKVTRRSITLPQKAVDAIFADAADSCPSFYVSHPPYKTATSLAISLWYEKAVYIIHLSLDGSSAEVSSYWGDAQLDVRNGQASVQQLEALKVRWAARLTK